MEVSQGSSSCRSGLAVAETAGSRVFLGFSCGERLGLDFSVSVAIAVEEEG